MTCRGINNNNNNTSLRLFLIVSCCLAACDGTDRPDLSELKIYRHSMDGAPTSLDPAKSATIYANFIVVNLYDTLYSYKYLARPYEIKPNLATALPRVSDDGLTFTITIKKGVHFVNDAAFPSGLGREVIAADFVYSIKRHFDPGVMSQGAWLWRGKIEGLADWKSSGSDYNKEVSGLRAIDRYTIQIRLTRPFPQLVYTLAMGFAAVVPHEAVTKYGPQFSIHPVGSGPFRLLKFDETHALLEVNRDFRKERFDLENEGFDPERDGGLGLEAIDGRPPPFVDQVDIQFIPEDAARWLSFTAGDEIQYLRMPAGQIRQINFQHNGPTLAPELADRYRMFAGADAEFVHIDFNMNDARIGYSDDASRNQRNHALRCAIRKAFDWEARNRIFYNDLGIIFPGIIPPVVPEFDPNADRSSVTYDLEGARELLSAAGWTPDNLPVLEYGMQSGVTQFQGFEHFRALLGRIGYPSNRIKKRAFASFGDFSRAYKLGQVQIFLLSWTLDYPDAENVLQLFYGPNAAPGSNNANFNNPQYNALYRQAAVLLPSDERTAIYQKMNQILIDECVTIAGLTRRSVYLMHKNIIAVPDRSILNGFFLRYVDMVR